MTIDIDIKAALDTLGTFRESFPPDSVESKYLAVVALALLFSCNPKRINSFARFIKDADASITKKQQEHLRHLGLM